MPHERSRSEAGWRIVAQWGDGDREGPTRIVIEPAPDIQGWKLRRGITTGVMRRLESHLTALTEDAATPQSVRVSELKERASKLPSNVRDPRYYPALLALFVEVKAVYASPIRLLAEAMNIPRGTLNNRLTTARRVLASPSRH